MSKLAIVTLVALFAQQSLAQLGSTGTGSPCIRNIDCPNNANCQMYDFYNYPTMWPPCPHKGYCVCNGGFTFATNGSCVQIVYLNLYQRCTNQIWESYQTPQQRCNGTPVICNSPSYIDQGGFCVPPPTPTVAFVPVSTYIPTVTCTSVSFLQQCDQNGAKVCCAAGTGLSCQLRGPNSTYTQCLCGIKTHIFDQQIGACRPRVYGDICVSSDECNSGLISNMGFECRLGRCRCSNGYEPVDNQYWNETSRSTYTRRICISSTATSWVPTGQACTMDPHLFAERNSTRVCHPRAFCHLCYGARANYVVGTSTVQTIGVCREFTCNGDGDCGNQGKCNNFGMQVDPPCDRGVCDCNWGKGYYKDRFSRCALYQNLGLGDRCINPDGATQLMTWYPNNEDWDDNKDCVAQGTATQGGYAGYNWGVVKCQLPLIEDADGNCVRNDDLQNQWTQTIGYMQFCDDNDNRLPIKRCDTSKGLTCVNNRCQCPQYSACSAGYGGCGATASSSINLWDGNMCRARGLADACNTSADCCGGSCNNGYCGCAAGLTQLQFSVGVSINNGDNSIQKNFNIQNQNYCFKNVSVVGKGQACHLSPVTWNCGNYRYGYYNTWQTTLVCQAGLVCLRCPFEFGQDDEVLLGTCRSVTPIPDTAAAPKTPCPAVNYQPGSQPAGQPQVQQPATGNWVSNQYVQTGWNGWNNGYYRNSAASLLSQSVAIAFLAVCAALVNF